MIKKTLIYVLSAALGIGALIAQAQPLSPKQLIGQFSEAYAAAGNYFQYVTTHDQFIMLENANTKELSPVSSMSFLVGKNWGFIFNINALKRWGNTVLSGSLGYVSALLSEDQEASSSSSKQKDTDSDNDYSADSAWHVSGRVMQLFDAFPGLGVLADLSLDAGDTQLVLQKDEGMMRSDLNFSAKLGAVQQFAVNDEINWIVGGSIGWMQQSGGVLKGEDYFIPAFNTHSFTIEATSQMKFKDLMDLTGVSVDWDAAIGLRTVKNSYKTEASVGFDEKIIEQNNLKDRQLLFALDSSGRIIGYADAEQKVSPVYLQTEVRAHYQIGIVDLMASVHIGYGNFFYGGIGLGLRGLF